jgi:hypothetical protein
MVAPFVSYGQALTAPGAASWSLRTVDWFRDHGLRQAVNKVENWYYSQHAPTNQPPPLSSLPTPPTLSLQGKLLYVPGPYPLPTLPGREPLPGESRWAAGRVDGHGDPLTYTAYVRPDPAHASVVAGVAWIRQAGTQAHLVAGTVQPGGSGWPGTASVPRRDVPRLVATFNSGWRMQDIDGGFELQHRIAGQLVTGEATAAIDDHGHLLVGEWGRDLPGAGTLVAVRQNLQLIVDHGQVVPGLDANAQDRWGSADNQLQYTARSGLGVDALGNLIYVAGVGMNLVTLAATMQSVGVVRGMQLDIHRQEIHFASWLPTASGDVTPFKLLPTMFHGADRYLNPDQRDFFYITE